MDPYEGEDYDSPVRSRSSGLQFALKKFLILANIIVLKVSSSSPADLTTLTRPSRSMKEMSMSVSFTICQSFDRMVTIWRCILWRWSQLLIFCDKTQLLICFSHPAYGIVPIFDLLPFKHWHFDTLTCRIRSLTLWHIRKSNDMIHLKKKPRYSIARNSLFSLHAKYPAYYHQFVFFQILSMSVILSRWFSMYVS